MARIIPNENTWIGFTETRPVTLAAPALAEINGADDVTCLVMSINASASGNALPTPDLCSLFEKSVPGTSQATFTADFYRDDTRDIGGDIIDEAWNLLPRNKRGYFFISRFGGQGVDAKPTSGDHVEVWPVHITSRTASALASNTTQTFTVNAAVLEEPVEDAVIGGAAALPTLLTLEGTETADGGSFAWTADLNGHVVTKVEYTIDGGNWVDAEDITTPFVVTGLTDEYHVIQVRVVTSQGNSNILSDSFTPTG